MRRLKAAGDEFKPADFYLAKWGYKDRVKTTRAPCRRRRRELSQKAGRFRSIVKVFPPRINHTNTPPPGKICRGVAAGIASTNSPRIVLL